MKSKKKILKIIESFTLNHPEIDVSFNNLKKTKFNKELLLNVFDEILEWLIIAGVVILFFVLFFGFALNEQTYITLVCVGVLLVITPCVIAMEYVIRTSKKDSRK